MSFRKGAGIVKSKSPLTKRRGTIYINVADYYNDYAKVQQIYANILPYRVELRFDRDAFEVMALSEAFDIVDDGEVNPVYEPVFWEENGYSYVKFDRRAFWE